MQSTLTFVFSSRATLQIHERSSSCFCPSPLPSISLHLHQHHRNMRNISCAKFESQSQVPPGVATRKNLHRDGRKPFGDGTRAEALVDVDGEPRLHIVFVHPQIHWNTGNIGRTCLGFGARLHLIEPLGFSLSSKYVRRAGLDYWSSVDLQVHPSFQYFHTKIVPSFSQVLYFTKYAQMSMLDVTFERKGKVAMIFGSEVDGFCGIEEELKLIDGASGKEKFVAFPMVNQDVFRAFNLSTTASMALWDAVRQLSRYI